MKPQWIIENIVKEPSYLALSDAVKRQGFDLLDLRGDYAKSMIADYESGCVIFSGSIEMAKLVGDQLRLQGNHPVAFNKSKPFKCTEFYGVLNRFLFNEDYVIVPLKELDKRADFFWKTFAKDDCLFVRPDSGEKTFKGTVLERRDLGKFIDINESELDKLAIVSTPKTITGEWRIVASSENKIIAGSSYRINGEHRCEPFIPLEAELLCQNIFEAGYHPEDVYCIDVARDMDGKYWLLELTGFSSAGLYECDKDAIVREVSRIALQQAKDVLAQRQ